MLAAALSAFALDVIGVSFDQIVVMALLSAVLNTLELASATGPVTVPLSTLEGHLSINDLLVFLMLGCAMVADRERYGAAVFDAARFYATVGDRDGCCR